MRLEAESEAIRGAFPAEYVDLAVLVTELGGSTVPLFALALLYWLTRRRETLLVVSYAVAGIGFVIALKALLAMGRPPESAHLVALEDDPYGFPSGHAFAATLVYGGLLVQFDRHRDRLATAAVAALISLVALSRVVLGFHYLGDVIVGAALGAAFLLGAYRVVAGDPRRGFALGVAFGVAAVAITGASSESLLALGGSLGGTAASTRLEAVPELRSRIEGAVLSAVGVGFVLLGSAAESAVAALSPAILGIVGVVAVDAALVAGIVLAPAAVGRLEAGPLEASRT